MTPLCPKVRSARHRIRRSESDGTIDRFADAAAGRGSGLWTTVPGTWSPTLRGICCVIPPRRESGLHRRLGVEREDRAADLVIGETAGIHGGQPGRVDLDDRAGN